jgi:hypothetical protein
MTGTRWEECTQRARALALEAGAICDAGGRTGGSADGGDLDPVWLGSAVGWLAEVAPSWGEMAGREPSERSYRRLFSAPTLEAWLICWPQDGRLELHDHGGASGAFQVVEGRLEERSLLGVPGAGGTLTGVGAEARDRTVLVGEPVAFDGRYIHDVRNTAAEAATSVHVYSAASRPMAFYRVDGVQVRTVALGARRSLVEAEAAAERCGASVAHPAGSRRGTQGVGTQGVGTQAVGTHGVGTYGVGSQGVGLQRRAVRAG